MPVAKWYLIANTDALLLLGCAAMFFCGMGVIVADEVSEHPFLDSTSVPSWVEHDGSSRLDADPTLVLPIGALEALVKAASDVLPASDATVEALKDAREVRDRTFSLLEKVVTNERNT